MESPMVRHQLVWVDVPCVDLDRAIAFYSAVLGHQVQKHEGPGFALGVFPHEQSSVSGCLVVSKDNQPAGHGVLIYLNCDGRLDEAVAAAESNGGNVLQPRQSIAPHGWRAIIRDSEGNRVALHST
jgi:predicted enzyme related to lactoylglutathione lyase